MKKLIISAIFFLQLGCANAERNGAFNSNDFCKILQLTIDLPKLQQFFHEKEIQNRSPLRVAVEDTDVTCIKLTKFNKKVILVDKNTISNQSIPFLELLKIDISTNLAIMSAAYSVEGIKITARLKKTDGSWELYESHVVEM